MIRRVLVSPTYLSKFIWLGLIAFVFSLGSPLTTKADTVNLGSIHSVSQLLGTAADYAVLGVGSSTAGIHAGTLNNSLVTINGNQGIGFGGTIINMAPRR